VDRRSHPRIERKYIPEASFFWAGGSLIPGPEFVPWEGKRRESASTTACSGVR
jgi:hypothetical protein